LKEEDSVKPDSLLLLVTGLTTILLVITTVALDRSLFTMKAGYWTRFAFIGLRYGVGAFIIWSLFVLIPFR
jgi:hypothetical protein